jgi:hypothetical protein
LAGWSAVNKKDLPWSDLSYNAAIKGNVREVGVAKLVEEIKYDVNFIKTHSLQPKWYKALKVVVLVTFFAGFSYFFGLSSTLVFFVVFFFLSFLVHMVYRVKTNKFTQSWLDFVVVEKDNEIKAKSIGKYYYLAIAINFLISLAVSQMLF